LSRGSMKVGNILFGIYLVLITAAALVLTDFISKEVNLNKGIDMPLIVDQTIFPKVLLGAKQIYALDPHLGYAHDKNDPLIKKFGDKYSWVDGFAVYSKKAITRLEHPIILVMGGSTTDGLHSDHSWPEKLSKLLAQKGISGTVVNGATEGYSSNQEL